MKRFFANLKYSLMRFFAGRYGNDILNWVLFIGGLGLSLISERLESNALRTILSLMALVMVSFGVFRTYSKNIAARRKELITFKSIFAAPANFVKIQKKKKEDQDHLYLRCPNCKNYLRVPKGKGRILITCPHCHNKVEIKS